MRMPLMPSCIRPTKCKVWEYSTLDILRMWSCSVGKSCSQFAIYLPYRKPSQFDFKYSHVLWTLKMKTISLTLCNIKLFFFRALALSLVRSLKSTFSQLPVLDVKCNDIAIISRFTTLRRFWNWDDTDTACSLFRTSISTRERRRNERSTTLQSTSSLRAN